MLGRLNKLTLGVVCASADGRTVYANPMIEHMVGPVPPGIPGPEWAARFGLARPDGAPYRGAGEIPLLRAQADGDSTGLMLSRDLGRDGAGATLLSATTVPVSDSMGRCLGSVGVFRPVGPSGDRFVSGPVPAPSIRQPSLGDSDRAALLLAALELSERIRTQLGQPLAERALQLIQDRYAENWTLSELAAELCVTPGHLTTIVAAHTGGGGLMHQLARVRVQAAARLLIETDETIETIGRRVGLPDRQRFLRTFQRHAGGSPGRYRAAARQSASDPREFALPREQPRS